MCRLRCAKKKKKTDFLGDDLLDRFRIKRLLGPTVDTRSYQSTEAWRFFVYFLRDGGLGVHTWKSGQFACPLVSSSHLFGDCHTRGQEHLVLLGDDVMKMFPFTAICLLVDTRTCVSLRKRGRLACACFLHALSHWEIGHYSPVPCIWHSCVGVCPA